MRFFKAFTILHRRTKSATFVPGPPPNLTSVSTRTSSFSFGKRASQQSNDTGPSLFDLVTAKSPPIPPHFSHLSDRATSLWRANKRQSGRSSMASIQSSMEKEHIRLKEAVNFWILEHSKLQNILNNCHVELIAERRKVLSLERKIEHDAQVIVGLRKDLSGYARVAEKPQLRFETVADIFPNNSYEENTQLPNIKPIISTLISPEPRLTFGLSTKVRTLDEYSSALRMTLAARKELRDQRKVTKFWKSKALMSTDQTLVTPSVSAISSLKEQTLSTERQAALAALITRRGLTSQVIPLSVTTRARPGSPSNTITMAEPMSSSNTLQTTMSTLPSSVSKISTFSRQSRLGPLASDSLKAEINFMFGSKDNFKKISTRTRKPRIGSDPFPMSVALRESPSSKSKDSKNPNSYLNIESFGDLNAIFDRAFGSGTTSSSFELSSASLRLDIPQASSSFIPIASIPSGSSQMFSEKMGLQNLTTGIKNKDATAHPSMKQASKDCTPRRSWQMYIGKANTSPKPITNEKRSSPKGAIVRKIGKGKENSNPLALSLPVLKTRKSRLPVPIFAKREL